MTKLGKMSKNTENYTIRERKNILNNIFRYDDSDSSEDRPVAHTKNSTEIFNLL